jgi:hypothetical protein
MKIKENINIRKIGDEYLLILNKGESFDYTRVVSMNGSAAFLLQQTGKQEFTVDQWTSMLVEKYEIDYERASTDAGVLIEKLRQAGVVE